MAQLNNVNPGDLIRAADWNALVAAVQALSGAVSVGGIVVPNLFGLTLSNAVAILNLPSTQLSQGTVIDTFGNLIDPSLSDSKPLVVLNQSPSAGASVFAGSSVNLVVTPKPGSAPPPPKLAAINAFKPTQVPIGAQLEIDGVNFDPLPTNNSVTFAGVQAAPPSGLSNPVQLFVIVPTGIPGAPTTVGQTLSVEVVVRTAVNGTTKSNVTILPPLATPLPVVQSFNPVQGIVGSGVTITGTGFDPTPANNTVNFDNVSVTAAAGSTTTQLIVTKIPDGINGLTTVPSFRNVPIIVSVVGGQQSPKGITYGIAKIS